MILWLTLVDHKVVEPWDKARRGDVQAEEEEGTLGGTWGGTSLTLA